MTVKVELHQLIDTLDEDAAAAALSFVRVLVAEQPDEAATGDTAREGILKVGKPTSEAGQAKPVTPDKPLWGIAGIGSSAGPTNVAKLKDEYLADAFAPKRS